MLSGNYRLAFQRLRAAKWNSALTMFGIIVGIVSVVTTVSMGEGVKRQILGQVNRMPGNLLTVRPGQVVSRDKTGTITKVNPQYAYGFGPGSLSEQDIAVLHRMPEIAQTSPISLLNSGAISGSTRYDDSFVLGTDAAFPSLLSQKIEFGSYFTAGEENRQVAIIGKRVAEQLFKENIPIGQTLTVRGQDFIVRGVFDEFSSVALGQGIDLNKAVFVPRTVLNDVAKGSAQIVRVLVKPSKGSDNKKLMQTIEAKLSEAHSGQHDITVLRQEENITIASEVLTTLTKFITGIAGIALLVGGVGIMNIMLVSVSERTYEIGIRKAVGATNRQIRNQFMAESIVLSIVGGVAGIIVSFVANYFIKIFTNFSPVIVWPVLALAVGFSLIFGIVFGTIPAIKAARKDPIEALRRS